ncbi:uncharacterized protein SPSK_02036 [Sporothrix schenckii 1099-18]|uniref:Uncharacterized protein n=1 Tax=Sporothrix schenckii 1099-18 TaxID=1397361 RepID=A0A0F2MDD7_SPOSC|nr:uncharacterized protein SPSK_02036 [Sporothrix schenckii 1099-18]KJR87094.1 hypothetical protein SPSK_02036 [Sporothrix schenckii 1099-18]
MGATRVRPQRSKAAVREFDELRISTGVTEDQGPGEGWRKEMWEKKRFKKEEGGKKKKKGKLPAWRRRGRKPLLSRGHELLAGQREKRTCEWTGLRPDDQ